MVKGGTYDGRTEEVHKLKPETSLFAKPQSIRAVERVSEFHGDESLNP